MGILNKFIYVLFFFAVFHMRFYDWSLNLLRSYKYCFYCISYYCFIIVLSRVSLSLFLIFRVSFLFHFFLIVVYFLSFYFFDPEYSISSLSLSVRNVIVI